MNALVGGLEQVVDNLLDNAIRAAPAGSAVTVAVMPGASGARLVIADRGPGIDDEDKAAALTRFWRADTSTPGTGLGLAICDAIVGAGGGHLRLDDNTPSGLRVTVTLATASGPS